MLLALYKKAPADPLRFTVNGSLGPLLYCISLLGKKSLATRYDFAFAAGFSGIFTLGLDSATSFSACIRRSFISWLSIPS